MIKLILQEHLRFSLAAVGKAIMYFFIWVLASFSAAIVLGSMLALWELCIRETFGYPTNDVSLVSGPSLTLGVLLTTIAMAAYLFREYPLRLPKMLFLTPTSHPEKRRYFITRFFLRLAFSLVAAIVLTEIIWGGFFFKKTLLYFLVQTCLFLFTMWGLILKTGIYGAFSRDSLEESRSLKEKIVNFYWILFLLLQHLFFYTACSFGLNEAYPALWLIWFLCLFADGALAKYTTGDYVEKALSYEQIYVKGR